jgi:mono/diheme cytochrome c family protein
VTSVTASLPEALYVLFFQNALAAFSHTYAAGKDRLLQPDQREMGLLPAHTQNVCESAQQDRVRIMALESGRIRCLTLCGILLLLMIPRTGLAQDSAAYFQTNCASCHTIGGGPLVGPDLANLLQRKDREWMLKFLANPQAVIDSGDPYAKKMLGESNGVVMPPVSGLDHEQTEALLDWIAAQSKSHGPQSGGESPAAVEPVFTAPDAALGRELARGSRTLANGGAPCISCHALRGIPMLGGGTLGPDLTHEYTRLGGGRAVTAWLTAPATPIMQSVYKTRALKPDEIHALAAYLESVSNQKEGSAAMSGKIFFLLGLGGCLIALVVMDTFWKKRFNAVRRPLVAGNRGR